VSRTYRGACLGHPRLPGPPAMVSVSKGPGPQERPFLREVAYPSKCNRADNFNQHKLGGCSVPLELARVGILTCAGGWRRALGRGKRDYYL